MGAQGPGGYSPTGVNTPRRPRPAGPGGTSPTGANDPRRPPGNVGVTNPAQYGPGGSQIGYDYGNVQAPWGNVADGPARRTADGQWEFGDPGSSPTPGGAPNPFPNGYPTGGGGGGGRQPNMADIMAIIGRKRPTPYGEWNDSEWTDSEWTDSEWTDLEIDPYNAPDFREFNGGQYDIARQGLAGGLARDKAAGSAAYGDARTEMQNYQNPFTNRGFSQNQGVPEAMQRMLDANNIQTESSETNRGVQADRAFGNVLQLLGSTADQRQASNQRALGGDERRFNESIDSQGRTMNLGIDMTEAKAKSQYEKDKWAYGENVARTNYETNMQVAIGNNAGRNNTNASNNQGRNATNASNNQGRNATNASNNQGRNSTDQANTQLGNDFDSGNAQVLIDLLAGGAKIDPALLAQFLGGAA